MTDIFYVYIYLYPNNVPFYIGQGKNNRWKQHFHDKRNPLKKNIIDKIITSGKEPIVKKLFENLYEDEAKIIEKLFISHYGRRNNKTGILANMTDGGEGISGYHFSEKAKEKMSETRSGKNHHLYGKHHSEETKRKMSDSHKG